MPTIVTGRQPTPNEPVPRTPNIFTLLGRNYPIHTHEDLAPYCINPRCQPDEVEEATLGPRFSAFRTDPRAMHFAAFLESIGRRSQPGFYYLHLVAPHSPWRYLPSGQRYPESDPEPGEIDPPGAGKAWVPDPWLTQQVYQRHLLQTALVDRLLGEFVRRLKRLDLYEKSLIAVIADHGVAFEPSHPKRVPTDATIDEVAPIPFFLKRPRRAEARIFDFPVQTLDILPTIADALNLPNVPRSIEGVSALKPIDLDRPRAIEPVAIDALGEAKYSVVEKKYGIFGPKGASLDLFDLGPGMSEELIGMKAADLDLSHSIDASATVPELESYSQAAPSDEVFPSLIEGSLTGFEEGQTIGVAVNGRIAATCRSYERDGEVRFAAMLSPKYFTESPNVIDLFAIEDVEEGSAIRLPTVSR